MAYQDKWGESESCSVVFYFLWPHTLYSPWNSLRQNTGVVSLSLLQRMFLTQGLNPGIPHWKSQSCLALCDPMDCSPPGSSIHGIFWARVLEWVAISFSRGSSRPRGWTKVSFIAGRHFTIWATRESLVGFLHWRQILYQLSHKRHPRILEWVAYPFSRWPSRPRNWTGVSCIAGGFFTNWAI